MPGSTLNGGTAPSAGGVYGGYGGDNQGATSQSVSAHAGAPQSGGAPNGGQHQLGGRPPLGQPAHGQPAHGQQSALGQPGLGQPVSGQPGSGAQQRGPAMPSSSMPPAAMPAGSMPSNGVMPLDAQRQPPPQHRQLPAANGAPHSTGAPYSQDRSMPYGGPAQPAQFGGPAGAAGYGPGSYGSQQPAGPPVTMSVGDAVQSAHVEGFGFGEAVARDAPALWLEAVLARKPRMPSDLEARLLQGSSLPIDSLLHDEVRHALRRGFWDALERSRH
jgi:hypothetical protein